MEKVDVVIAVVGAVAILATFLGVLFYEEAQGNVDIVFNESANAESDSHTAVSAGSHPFTVDLIDNATALRDLVVTIEFTGQQSPLAGGGGSYKVEVRGPNDTYCEQTATWSTTTQTVPIDECRWAQSPNATAAPSLAEVDAGMRWNETVEILVIIQNPGDQLAGQGPIAYTYNVSYTADLMAYKGSVKPVDAGNI